MEFASLASVQLPSSSRLIPAACCPDKDLVVLISKRGAKDVMSLWKMQGARKWEVDLDGGENGEIVGLAWSPDGQTIAVAHDPHHITLHSIQDGREERHLSIPQTSNSSQETFRVIGIWWFKNERKTGGGSIPDILRRESTITGSAHSILKTQPLLDYLQDDTQPLTATDLFAFQGPQARIPIRTPSLPEVIEAWPTLPPDPIAASVKPSPRTGDIQHRPENEADEIDDANFNSLLVVADNLGRLHCFLDGTYVLGSLALGVRCRTISLFQDMKTPVLFAHAQIKMDGQKLLVTNFLPVPLHLPLLEQPTLREVAHISSTARELVWYVMRVVKEMRGAWFGSDSNSGARDIGALWVRDLGNRQRDHFGNADDQNAMLDLTSLLVTGRSSEPLSDLLGSGDQMSERGISKWESTVTEALTKLRDSSERRVAPACQRLHVVLEDAKGWSQMHGQYGIFGFESREVDICLRLTERAVFISNWLASTARRELSRFKEFIAWLRYETSKANPTSETHTLASPRHDILEVNSYLMSGLVVSSIDKWFMGPIPQFSPEELGIAGTAQQSLSSVMERARLVANDSQQIAWQRNVKHNNLDHLDRNIDALAQELATRCQRIFVRAAGAAGRSAITHTPTELQAMEERMIQVPLQSFQQRMPSMIRERTVTGPDQISNYLAIRGPSTGQGGCLCLTRMTYSHEHGKPSPHVDVGIVGFYFPDEGENETETGFNLLEMEFFDDENLVIVYRLLNGDPDAGRTFIALVGYSDIEYQELEPSGYVMGTTREYVGLAALERFKGGQLPYTQIPIKRSRELSGCGEGGVSLAVNGRVGRKVACVLDEHGLWLEVIDLAGEADEAPDEDEEKEEEEDPEGVDT